MTFSRVVGGETVLAKNTAYVPAKDPATATVTGNIGASVALGNYQVRVVVGVTSKEAP